MFIIFALGSTTLFNRFMQPLPAYKAELRPQFGFFRVKLGVFGNRICGRLELPVLSGWSDSRRRMVLFVALL